MRLSDYNTFLETKLRRAEVIGPEPIEPHAILFPFQRQIVRWAIRKGRAAIFAACGTGKTLMQLEWARQMGGRVLIVAPLCVADQTVEEALKVGMEVRKVARPEKGPGIFITNYEKLQHFKGVEYDAIVLDECFAPDTPVEVLNIDNTSILKHIKDVRVGDRISNASGGDYVKAIYKRRINGAVRVTTHGHRVVCSENHPFFTLHGWRSAKHLRPGDYVMETGAAVRLVRDHIRPDELGAEDAAILRSILLSEMEDEHSRTQGKGSQSRGSSQAGEIKVGMVQVREPRSPEGAGTDQKLESDERAGGPGESISYVAENEAQTFRAWGQWSRDDLASAIAEGCTVRELDTGIYYITGEANTRFSNLLQSRLGQSNPDDCHGGGREQPLFQETQRPEEGCKAGFVRVDSVEILEQGHPELDKYRDAEGHLYFYDIKAERHPSFSVNGMLVHNSSILKSLDGKTRTMLLQEFTHIKFRLCCTATPAPNDIAEMGNHAQFLGVMKDSEMKATFFVHDDNIWRLKRHAAHHFYKWMASWCVYVRYPSDIGFEDDRFLLPELHIQEHVVGADYTPIGLLFALPVNGIRGRFEARRSTIKERVEQTAALILDSKEQWLVWCGLNEEGRRLAAVLKDQCVLVEGSDSEEAKIDRAHRWLSGDVRVLVSKAKIFGFGMNFQNCHNIAFLGLGDSWESYYQAIRRCWRFGQKHPVEVHIVISEAEEAVADNIQRKEKQAQHVAEEVIRNMGDLERAELSGAVGSNGHYVEDEEQDALGRWTLKMGDSCKRIKEIPDGSVGLSVFSPPFAALYTYTDSERDMGNSKGYDEFFSHFRYLIPELLRVTMPGRRCCVHVQQVAMKKAYDGVIGWMDFRADVVREFVQAGWVYDGEVVIDKDPQAQAIRTKSKSLMFVQLKKDSVWSRPAMADYILPFRHPGENPEPIDTDVDNNTWIQWARPIWYGIRENDTLHVAEAREEKDERHICPLQLGTIERCIRLWSNAGDTVLDPFSGIGSTGYQALKLGRKAVGIELKASYFRCAVRNLKAACQPSLFDVAEVDAEAVA